MPSNADGLSENSDFSAVTRKMKARAPPPPAAPQPAPRKIFRNAIPDGGAAPDTKENVIQSTVDLQITLPNGYGTLVTVDGRKALMDMLVDLCAQYHLNPAEHTLELASAEGQPVSFKPNTVLGTLHVSRALIKHRTQEERLPRKPAPKVPEKTVRLVVNYHRGQKAVVRVNPLVPLQSLVPVICQKCEFNPARVLLLRDAVSHHELDLRKSLTELEIRELYVLDQTLVLQPKMVSAPVLNFSAESLNSDTQSASAGEKKGLLGLFKFSRRKSKTEEFIDDMDQHNTHTNINGLSPVTGVCVEARPNTLGQSQSAMNLSRLSPKTEPKKRRAPAPPHPLAPMLMDTQMQLQCRPAPVAQTKPGSPSQLKKRKAPPPPPSVHPTTSSSPALVVAAAQVPNTMAASDDSMSDLSHSIEDSEPAASICSSSSSDDAAESSSLAEETMAEPAIELATGLPSKVEPVPKLNQQPARRSFVKRDPEEMESALELKMEEVDNSRHSAIVWLHVAEQEAETVSMCSSESLADQGYAPSEGMADSPSTSPEDTVSLGPDPSLSPTQPQEDCDSDEGCATWGSRHSGNMRPGDQSVKRNDTEITAQIHLTLADLDADLADEVNQSDHASVYADDEIPVSVVDMDIPVTAIDEVIDNNPTSSSAYEAEILRGNQVKQDGSNKQILDLQYQNNKVRMSKKASPSQADPIQSGDKKEQTEKVALSPGIKGKVEPDKRKLPETSQSPAITTVTRSAQNVPESRLWPASTVQNHHKENTEVERASSIKAQNMISQNTMSRFGLKTFTIVPTKPVGSQNHIKSEGSLRTGAIKIDELGNMVTPRDTQDKSDRLEEASDDRDSPLLDKAKAFWSSTSKDDSAPTAYKRASIRTGDVETPKPLPVTVPSQPAEKASVTEPPKQVNGPSTNLASAVMKKLAVSDPAENIFFSEHRKNLSFLKPSRRTSSHYVASAITKYTGNSSSKVDGVQELPGSMPAGHTELSSQAFKSDPRPMQAVSNQKASTLKENSVPFLAAAKPYLSYPAEKQEVSREAQIIGTDVSSTKALNSSPGNSQPQQQARIATCSEPTRTSTKEDIYIKKAPGYPLPLNSTVHTTRPAVAKKPELHSLGLQPSPFGPVKKFKPVVPKSVEKETSLHSSLMEAIQSGHGMERLKKVSDSSRPGTLKKPSYTEPENERSALLSALRAENNSARLKKTSSSAAAELEQFRKFEENRASQRRTSPTISPAFANPPTFTPPPPSFTPPPPPSFTPPPPPPTFTPPPPPPTLSLSKPAVVLPAGGNPESAREALLEAIRSGAGAERLRKVPVSTKTVKVNGRLGTIQASASPPQEP
ncbi:protein cordon-bleu isoform X5 [Hemibagrus wyckioides]|uniref:protein cordon-bleu isoform X5 n=1 Tax=Hemibagrus wyckioides TaxID=337641 RepID=UPI00266C5B72|nr:protein cordon-bleu isoform X5 [Hemibagrus wyckioides]